MQYTRVTATTGSTVSAAAGDENLALLVGPGVTSVTVNFPPSPNDGDPFYVSLADGGANHVTGITYADPGGATITPRGANLTGGLGWRYTASANQWDLLV